MNRDRNAPPFSRPLLVEAVGTEPMPLVIRADEAEKAGLAQMDGLAGIDELEADLTVSREGRSGLHVTGTVKARIRQICVVSLDPFEADLLEPVDVHFLPEAEVAALATRRPSPDDTEAPEEDLPDPIVGGRIDLGALAAEFLALGLDPYPRKPGVAFVEPQRKGQDSADPSPFAALGRLRQEGSG